MTGKDKTLASSLHGRVKNEKIESTPAPGDYDPQKAVKIIQYCSPKYSFGVKTPMDKTITTPGKLMWNKNTNYKFILSLGFFNFFITVGDLCQNFQSS